MTTTTPSPPDGPHACALLHALHDEQLTLYPTADDPTIDVDQHTPPCGLFLIAWDQHGNPVGCGAVRRFAHSIAEIRKMYVVPAWRGSGLGQRLLDELESFARDELSATTIRLETGIHNTSALRLYDAAGYHPIDSYVDGRASFNAAREKPLDVSEDQH